MATVWVSRLLRALGVAAVILAMGGFIYTGTSIFWVAAGTVDQLAVEHNATHVHASFYTMASICLLFYSVILVCGVQFFRLRGGLWWLFALVLLLEVALQFVVGRLWLHPTLGQSVAAATGIALGGLSFQFLLGFPFWAPVVAYLCNRSLKTHAL
jgi:hypothetical protein